MKKSTRNLIIMGACIAVLGGALAALLLTGGNGGENSSSSSSSSAASITLVGKSESELKTMKVTNRRGSYTLEQKEGEASSSSSSDSSSAPAVSFAVAELSGFPVDDSIAAQAAKYGYGLEAARDLGETEDLAQYGLSDPEATVELTFTDGSGYTYQVGGTVPGDETKYYLCEKGKKQVYIAGLDDLLLESTAAFVSKDVLALSVSDDAAVKFESVKLSGADYPEAVTLTLREDGAFLLNSGLPADSASVTAITDALTTLTASKVYALSPDAEMLKKLGLDIPAAAVAFTADGKAYRLILSGEMSDQLKDEDGDDTDAKVRYAMLDGLDAVFAVDPENVSAWAKTNEFTLRRKTFFKSDVASIQKVTVRQSSGTVSLNVSRVKNEESSTEEQTVYDYMLADSTGKQHGYSNAAYRQFLASLTATEILEAASAPSGTPEITVEIQFFDKDAGAKLEFYNLGNRRYTVVADGKPYGQITLDDAENILNKLDTLLKEEYTPDSSSSAES